MKFYGNGLVWDKEKNKPLCRFVDGTIETEDTDIIKKLIGGGYDNDSAELIDITTYGDVEKKYMKVIKEPSVKATTKQAPKPKAHSSTKKVVK